jgi:cytochrome b6-f complex iron-sulfur subunit
MTKQRNDGVSERDDTPGCGPCPIRDAVSRREFVSIATMSAIAVTLSACGGGELGGAAQITQPTPTTPTPTTPGTPTVGANQIGVSIASYAALANVGGVAKVNNSPAIALARTATGFVAFSLRCPHEGTTVAVQSGTSLRCPNHGALFASSGTWNGGFRTSNLSQRTVKVSTDKTFVVVNLV